MTGYRSRRRPEPAPAGQAVEAKDVSLFAEGGEQQVVTDRQSERAMTEHEREPEAELVPAPPTAPEEPEKAEDPRVLQAQRAWREGLAARAVELYREALLDRPRDVGVRLALGRLYDDRREYHLALEQFEAARDSAPDDVLVMVAYANALAQVGRFDASERELRRALRLEPGRPEVHASLGIINFRRGVYELAEQELKRAIELDPSTAAAFHYRGESLNQLGRVDEALTMLERAAHLEPNHARTFYVMGIVFDKKGRPQEAAAMYRKAREITVS
jgi:tetratricopeptide (TPR) repeat protein